jgi:hypothetical protein
MKKNTAPQLWHRGAALSSSITGGYVNEMADSPPVDI